VELGPTAPGDHCQANGCDPVTLAQEVSQARPTNIMVLSGSGDRHAIAVEALLKDAGHGVVWFDYGTLPQRAEMVFSTSSGGRSTRRLLRMGATTIDLSTVTAIWMRRPGTVISSHPKKLEIYPKAETTQYVLGLLDSLGCPWFPAAPTILRIADRKIEQLSRAQALGFQVPATLVTNSPREFLAFFNAHEGQIISKVAESPSFEDSYDDCCRYTEAVKRRDLTFWTSVRNCPVLFQANVPKKLEVRATVVGSKVFAAEIHSQGSRQAAQDWRRYDEGNVVHRVHQLPERWREACVDLVRQLGLQFGTIDLILRPDGEYVFLEVNPGGQYLWIEQLTGLPISEAVAEHLAALSA
jgi:glutathione synthase/RimK-type ligase-like ATP-grasp enzyme